MDGVGCLYKAGNVNSLHKIKRDGMQSSRPVSFVKEKRVLFFAERKERKEAASLRLDRLCGRQWFDGGYERRHPRSRSSRDPRAAAVFVDIVPEGALAPAGAGFLAAVASRTACSAVACVPFVVRKHVSGAVCMHFSAEVWEFEAVASMLPCNAEHCIVS